MAEEDFMVVVEEEQPGDQMEAEEIDVLPIRPSQAELDAEDAALLAALANMSEGTQQDVYPAMIGTSQQDISDIPADFQLLSQTEAQTMPMPATQQQPSVNNQQNQREHTRPKPAAAQHLDEDLLEDAYMFESELHEYLADQDDIMPEDYADEQPAPTPADNRQDTGRQRHQQQAANKHGKAAEPHSEAFHTPGPQQRRTRLQDVSPSHPTNTNAIGVDVIDNVSPDSMSDKEIEAVVTEPLPPAVNQQPPRVLASDVAGECLSVMSACGLRVYCGVAPPAQNTERLDWQKTLNSSTATAFGRSRASTSRHRLLSRPISDMMRELQEVQLQAALSESRRLAAELDAAAAAQNITMIDTQPAGRNSTDGGAAAAAQPAEAGTTAARQSQLWVSKYAPRKFMSLLSDEQVNRQVAKWVKSWDPCVFGMPFKDQHPTGQNSMAQQLGKNSSRGTGRPGMHSGDDDKRPEKKCILLCGPPGLGKTTLAHVVARHCGYHPYEINASDDRTAQALTDRVTDAVHMQAVLGSRKPNCVIVDEIDGATGGSDGGGAITALLAIINAKGNKQAAPQGDAQPGPKKNRKRGLPPLSRPIICIANDLYAPALRPLRDVAQIFHFKPPDIDKLVSRLAVVCAEEGVHIDKAALFALAQRSDCDIRTCLNTLQFLAKQQQQQQRHRQSNPGVTPGPVRHASRTPGGAAGLLSPGGLQTPNPRTTRHNARNALGSPPPTSSPMTRPTRITLSQVQLAAIGSKDTNKGMFALWDAMLHLPRHTVNIGGNRPGSKELSPQGKHLLQLYNLLQDNGEYDLVMSGLHENLPALRYLDVHLKNTAAMADALSNADILLSTSRRRVEHALMSYVPALLLQIHLRAAQPEKPTLQWPRAGAEHGRRAAAGQELLRTWCGHKVAARVLQAHDAHTLSLEVLPALIRMLAPNIRALAPNLLTPGERSAMHAAASLLVDFGLLYDMSEGDEAQLKQQKGRKLGAAGVSGQAAGLQGAAGLPRPVPLEPPLDMLQLYGAASTGPATGALIAPSSLFKPRFGVSAMKPVPGVLRQLLNQQATLEVIRRKELSSPVGDVDMTDGIQSPPQSQPDVAHQNLRTSNGKQQLPSKATTAVNNRVAIKQPKTLAPVDTNAIKQPGSKEPSKNWLETARVNAINKRKAQIAAACQQNKRQAVAGDNDQGPVSPPGKVKFPVLYRHNEGYTNAVKRPLLMKELL